MSYPPPPYLYQESMSSLARCRKGNVYEKTLAFTCGGLDNLLAFVGGGYGD